MGQSCIIYFIFVWSLSHSDNHINLQEKEKILVVSMKENLREKDERTYRHLLCVPSETMMTALVSSNFKSLDGFDPWLVASRRSKVNGQGD